MTAELALDQEVMVDEIVRDGRISRALRWFACVALICATSGTLLFCYAHTLARWRELLIWIHEYSGDASAALLGLYLIGHLRRTWRMRRARALSWWTGIGGTAAWVCASVTGIYGQFAELSASAIVWWLHALGSFLAVVVVFFHAAQGFQRLYSNRKEIG